MEIESKSQFDIFLTLCFHFFFVSYFLSSLLNAHTVLLAHTNRWWGNARSSVTHYPLIQSCQLAARSSTARLGRGTAAIWEQCSWCWTFCPRHLARKTSQKQCIFCLAEIIQWTHPAAVLSVVLKAHTTYQTLIYGWQNLQGALDAKAVAYVVKIQLGSFYSFCYLLPLNSPVLCNNILLTEPETDWRNRGCQMLLRKAGRSGRLKLSHDALVLGVCVCVWRTW